ncbi:MAG: hypothetical protein NVSMB68_13500 [Thermoanaerobaculia bacterium]
MVFQKLAHSMYAHRWLQLTCPQGPLPLVGSKYYGTRLGAASGDQLEPNSLSYISSV